MLRVSGEAKGKEGVADGIFLSPAKKSRWREIRTKTLPSRGCFRDSAAAGEIRDIQKYISRTYTPLSRTIAHPTRRQYSFSRKKSVPANGRYLLLSPRGRLFARKRRRGITEETLEAA